MNKTQASKWIGKEFRIRPIAIRMTDIGERLPQEDAKWLVSDVSDIEVTILRVGTDHPCQLGLDNVREYRTPDFLLLRCQLTLRGDEISSEPIIVTSVDRNISGFESLLKHSWVREFIGAREVWISEVDNLFQVELGDNTREFSEEWTRRFPDKHGSTAFPVLLKVQGVEIKQLTFISCDGGRIIVPMPKVVSVEEQSSYTYDRNSLEYRVGQIIGKFYIYNTLDGLARRAGINVS